MGSPTRDAELMSLEGRSSKYYIADGRRKKKKIKSKEKIQKKKEDQGPIKFLEMNTGHGILNREKEKRQPNHPGEKIEDQKRKQKERRGIAPISKPPRNLHSSSA